MPVSKDAAQQLYRSIFATLTGDTVLTGLLASVTDKPKVYQTFIDFDSPDALKGDQWVTYNVVSDRPAETEQMQDVREIVFDVHIWAKVPQSDNAEAVEKRIRELLDNGDLSTSQLFSWYCYAYGYYKTYDAQLDTWHLTSTYHTMCMAVSP